MAPLPPTVGMPLPRRLSIHNFIRMSLQRTKCDTFRASLAAAKMSFSQTSLKVKDRDDGETGIILIGDPICILGGAFGSGNHRHAGPEGRVLSE